MAIESVSRTHVGIRRKVNEDSVLDRAECGLWAVADGMGGHDAGDVASARVVEALASIPRADGLDGLLQGALDAMQRVNQDLIALAGAMGSERTIGSTVVGLAIIDGKYRCFWAGDSRAYRLRAGNIERLTRDHSLVQDLVDAGMLQPAEAEDHPNSNIITRAVGVAADLRVDVVSGEAEPGDQFLLASDGLTRLVDDQELASQLAAMPTALAADQLIETALARGAPDNVSLVIARVD